MKEINFKELGKAIFLIILYMLIIPYAIGTIVHPFLPENTNEVLVTLLNLTVYVVDIVIFFVIYRRTIFKELHSFFSHFREYFKVALKNWGKGFAWMFLVNYTLLLITGGMAANEEQNRELLVQIPVFSVLAMVVLGPILEEIAFRKGFRNVFKKKQTFLIATAILFGSMHIIQSIDYSSIGAILGSWKQILYVIPYSILGYYFGKAYYETDCIFTSITAHMLHNGLSVAVVLLSSSLL